MAASPYNLQKKHIINS